MVFIGLFVIGYRGLPFSKLPVRNEFRYLLFVTGYQIDRPLLNTYKLKTSCFPGD